MTVINIDRITSISLVTIDGEIMRKVAERCSVDVARIQRYLDTDEENDQFLRAFLFFGVGPIGKGADTLAAKKAHVREQAKQADHRDRGAEGARRA